MGVCNFCGTNLSDVASVCANCGAPVKPLGTVNAVVADQDILPDELQNFSGQSYYSTNTATKVKRRSKALQIFGTLVVFALIFGSFAITFFINLYHTITNRSPGTTTVTTTANTGFVCNLSCDNFYHTFTVMSNGIQQTVFVTLKSVKSNITDF
jgi:hypothetical protein